MLQKWMFIFMIFGVLYVPAQNGAIDEDLVPDTAEFDPEIQELMKTFTSSSDREKIKRALKKSSDLGYYKGSSLTYHETFENHFEKHFDCFIDSTEQALELKHFQLHFDKKTMDAISLKPSDSWTLELPEHIKIINETRDTWMYEKFKYSTPSTMAPRKRPNSTVQVPRLTRYFRQWHYLITLSKQHQPGLFADLKEKLIDYYNSHKIDYTSEEEVFQLCAAHFARSYVMTGMIRKDLRRIMNKYKKTNKDSNFDETLFFFIPYWYVDEEQLSCIDILRSLYVLGDDKFEPIQKLYFLNKWNGTFDSPAEPDYTIIPYLNSTRCHRLNSSCTVTTPVGYQRRSSLNASVQS